MKKLSVLSLGLCVVLALASCGTSKESAYRKAYERAQAQEAQQAQQAPAVEEPVVTPLETTTPSQATNTEVDNATVRQENVTLVSGAGLQNYSVVVGSFSLKANAEGLASTLKNAGYDSQIVLGERNMYRVVAATFADKAGAVKSRNQLRSSGKYPDAWLLFNK